MTADKRSLTWEDRIETLTHLLIHPTKTPSLHSQLFVAARFPCFLRWDYPPFLCEPDAPETLRWSTALFLRRVTGFERPTASWRSKCPFQIPPPMVLSCAEEPAPARWEPEVLRERLRRRLRRGGMRRLRRGRLGLRVPPLLVVAVPNLVLLLFLFCDPNWAQRRDNWA
ncbi:uncharacterized protein LOC110038405 [Phalaenopsis equestris]|uniref:uncharacterized protein LOC110038405 n=1 Tax=Phalaenopsis equestris TaxID=78828 RepID=UPI0009E1C5E0|nr:uncharacterized protein LOC110038405 [Phalaenopsis equestris]